MFLSTLIPEQSQYGSEMSIGLPSIEELFSLKKTDTQFVLRIRKVKAGGLQIMHYEFRQIADIW